MDEIVHELLRFNAGGESWPHYKHKEIGIQGVGRDKRPFVVMDEYLEGVDLEELHTEALQGLALTLDVRISGGFPGEIVPEEVENYGAIPWSQMLYELAQNDPDNKHMKAIDEMLQKMDPSSSKAKKVMAVYKYAQFAMGALIPWFFTVYVKKSRGPSRENFPNSVWMDNAKLFPKLLKFIETLPFKEVGRIMFFCTYPNTGVPIHRDHIMTEHMDHTINFFLGQDTRPSFIYDEISKTKVYLPEGTQSYYFNDRDYHGVDKESSFKYTLRVDGIFTDDLCEKLGLENEYTWKQSY